MLRRGALSTYMYAAAIGSPLAAFVGKGGGVNWHDGRDWDSRRTL
jgi:hypothetical protein